MVTSRQGHLPAADRGPPPTRTWASRPVFNKIARGTRPGGRPSNIAHHLEPAGRARSATNQSLKWPVVPHPVPRNAWTGGWPRWPQRRQPRIRCPGGPRVTGATAPGRVACVVGGTGRGEGDARCRAEARRVQAVEKTSKPSTSVVPEARRPALRCHHQSCGGRVCAPRPVIWGVVVRLTRERCEEVSMVPGLGTSASDRRRGDVKCRNPGPGASHCRCGSRCADMGESTHMAEH